MGNPKLSINNISQSDDDNNIIDLSTHGKPIICCKDDFVELTQSQRNYIDSLVNLINELCSNHGYFITYDISLDNQYLLLHMFEYPTSQTEAIIELTELSYNINQLTFDFECIRNEAIELYTMLIRELSNYEKND